MLYFESGSGLLHSVGAPGLQYCIQQVLSLFHNAHGITGVERFDSSQPQTEIYLHRSTKAITKNSAADEICSQNTHLVGIVVP